MKVDKNNNIKVMQEYEAFRMWLHDDDLCNLYTFEEFKQHLINTGVKIVMIEEDQDGASHD